MPPSAPIDHYFSSDDQLHRTEVLFHYSMQHYSGVSACLEHSNFFKVRVPGHAETLIEEQPACCEARRKGQDGQFHSEVIPPACSPDPTTSFLTATALIYANGAGITAAAGTRLALH